MLSFASNWWRGGPTNAGRWCRLAVVGDVAIVVEVGAVLGAAFGTAIVVAIAAVVAVVAAVIVVAAVKLVVAVVIVQFAMNGHHHLEGRRRQAGVGLQH